MVNRMTVFISSWIAVLILGIVSLAFFEHFTLHQKQMIVSFIIYYYLSVPIIIIGEKLNVFDSNESSKYKKIFSSVYTVWLVGLMALFFYMLWIGK